MRVRLLAGQAAPIHSMRYSNDGRLLVTCGGDGSVKVWAVGDMEVLLTFCGHMSEVMKMCKTGDSRLLATASESGELAFWDLRLAQELASTIGSAINLGTN
jgi:WD40 repeat protein